MPRMRKRLELGGKIWCAVFWCRIRVIVTVLTLMVVVWVPVYAHSWLHCTDYDVPEGNDFYTMPELLDSFNISRYMQ